MSEINKSRKGLIGTLIVAGFFMFVFPLVAGLGDGRALLVGLLSCVLIVLITIFVYRSGQGEILSNKLSLTSVVVAYLIYMLIFLYWIPADPSVSDFRVRVIVAVFPALIPTLITYQIIRTDLKNQAKLILSAIVLVFFLAILF